MLLVFAQHNIATTINLLCTNACLTISSINLFSYKINFIIFKIDCINFIAGVVLHQNESPCELLSSTIRSSYEKRRKTKYDDTHLCKFLLIVLCNEKNDYNIRTFLFILPPRSSSIAFCFNHL